MDNQHLDSNGVVQQHNSNNSDILRALKDTNSSMVITSVARTCRYKPVLTPNETKILNCKIMNMNTTLYENTNVVSLEQLST